jgi:AraC-like DNA-binding protein
VDLEYHPNYRRTQPWIHTLDIVLLSFILRGRGRHIMEDDVYEEHGCSLGITHYGQQHCIVTDDHGMDIMNIFLDPQNHPLPELPGKLRDILPELIPLYPGFQHRLNRIVRLQFDDAEPVTRLVFAMHDEIQGRRPGYAEAVRHYLTLFLMHCCRHVLAQGLLPSVSHRRDASPALEELRRYLDRTYAERHTLEELARRAGVSRNSLCRAFKSYTGKSIFEYLLDHRVQAAMVRLRSGNEKMLAVALECGFGDAAFFNRTFRARVGMTSTAYRAHSARLAAGAL